MATKTHPEGGKITFSDPEYLYSAIINFILCYITIVFQGDGIVATLDHLATYFRDQDIDAFGSKASNEGEIKDIAKFEKSVEIDGPGTIDMIFLLILTKITISKKHLVVLSICL